MSRYASSTDVSAERTRAEIESTLLKYGATAFSYLIRNDPENSRAAIQFEHDGKGIQFNLPLPSRAEFARTPTGLDRKPSQQQKHWEQACRQRWRALALCIKAKLESVQCGITTFEQEFLAHIMIPGTTNTIGQEIIPKIETAYRENKVPLLTFGGDLGE